MVTGGRNHPRQHDPRGPVPTHQQQYHSPRLQERQRRLEQQLRSAEAYNEAIQNSLSSDDDDNEEEPRHDDRDETTPDDDEDDHDDDASADDPVVTTTTTEVEQNQNRRHHQRAQQQSTTGGGSAGRGGGRGRGRGRGRGGQQGGRAAGDSTSRGRRSTKNRGPGFTKEETEVLLDFVQDHLPISGEEWEDLVTKDYNERFTENQRDFDSLRRKFFRMANASAPTGDPNCPPHIRRAKHIKRWIEERADGAREIHEDELGIVDDDNMDHDGDLEVGITTDNNTTTNTGGNGSAMVSNAEGAADEQVSAIAAAAHRQKAPMVKHRSVRHSQVGEAVSALDKVLQLVSVQVRKIIVLYIIVLLPHYSIFKILLAIDAAASRAGRAGKGSH